MSKSSQWNADEKAALAERVDIDIEKKLDLAYDALQYWEKRCEAAEEYIRATGYFRTHSSDENAVKLFTESFQKWHTLKNDKHKYIPIQDDMPF